MDTWTFWLIMAAGLLVLEICTASLIFLYSALGSVFAMCASLSGYDWTLTLPLFGVSSILLYVATHRLRKRIRNGLYGKVRHAPTGMEALIGRTGKLSGQHELRLRVDGDSWRVRPKDPSVTLNPGDSVRVTSFDSIVLTVEKVV